MRYKKMFIGLICFFIILCITLIFASNFFYKLGISRNEKTFLSNSTAIPTKTVASSEATTSTVASRGGTSNNNSNNKASWFYSKTIEILTIDSFDNLKLNAKYIEADKKTDTTVILAHGYSGSSYSMTHYAEFFSKELGFNVLLPDARGHGESEGDYIGFGWHDRQDYIQWIDTIIKKNGIDSNIVLYGVSMGGATVLMTSGEELPSNVKAVINDCGYTSVEDQLSFQLKQMYKLPAFPMIQLTSVLTKARAGYSFKEASALNQVKKSKTPILFIHGDNDNFVPLDMVYQLYDAANSEKELLIIEGAEHGNAFETETTRYKNKVIDFLNKYL